MALPHEMYPPKPLSPSAKLASGISDTDMTLTLNDAGVLPEGPNVLSIGELEDEETETILYSSVSGNVVTVAARGYDGTTAKAWSEGAPVARLLTAQDITALQENVSELADTKATATTYTTTLDTTWTGNSAPYTKTQTVAGILSTDNPIVDIMMSGNFETDKARIEAWASVYRITTANDSITVYATEKPTVELPIQIKVVR